MFLFLLVNWGLEPPTAQKNGASCEPPLLNSWIPNIEKEEERKKKFQT
jgi:hypothetical protein